MERVQLTDNFFLDEFFPPDFCEKGKDFCFLYMEKQTILRAQKIREMIGKPISVNDWYQNTKAMMKVLKIDEFPEFPLQFLKENKVIFHFERGLRKPESKTGAKHSQHKYEDLGNGRIRKATAHDLVCSGMNGYDWLKFVKENAKELYKLGLTTVEYADLTSAKTKEGKLLPFGWMHGDGRPTQHKGFIQVVDLKNIIELIPT